jgi:hypothetical protein
MPIVSHPFRNAATVGFFGVLFATSGAPAAELAALRVSDDHRSLVSAKGPPFFWLGDTAWELFHRLNREDADRYLTKRAEQGFTVVQAVALNELDGHSVPSAYGHLPLTEMDPNRPAVVDGPANDYWDHVDYVVDKANSLGIYVALLPTWGRYWHDPIKDGKPLFNPANAERYGEWLGRRFKDRPGVVWVLGGDRTVDNDEQRELIRAMARGLRHGDGGAHLITFHPPGGAGSSRWFHEEPWLDFNMRQNGHVAEYTGRYDQTRADYDKQPTKPVLDGEPLYEDHPLSFKANELGHSIAADVRRPLYWNLFGGAFGHTYGHHSVWQMWSPDKHPVNNPLMPWNEALDQPGANQMQHGRHLLESRPGKRVPDDSLIVTSRVPTAEPGAGRYRFSGTRASDGAFAMIYVPAGRPFSVRKGAVSGERMKAWWFNPRTGEATDLGERSTGEVQRFAPTELGEELDWVLVLDAVDRRFGAPGQKAAAK